MTEQTDLAVIPRESALTVFTEPKGLDPYLAKIRAEIDGFTGDISTKKGREAVASMAFKIARSKSYLESVGKALADEQKEIPKKIDASRKLVRDTLDAWKDEVRAPLTAWEEAEEARQTRIKDAINELQALAQDREPRTAEVMRERLAEVRAEAMTEELFAEYLPAAIAARDTAITALTGRIADAEQRERDAAELAALRKAAAEREAKERDERIAREAAEKAKADAEAHAKRLADEAERKANAEAQAAAQREREQQERAERAEREAAEAEKRAQLAEAAARVRADAEQKLKIEAEKAEAERREANKKHRAKINNAAIAAFVAGGMPEDMAKLAVTLIAQRSIPAVSVAY